MTAEPTAADLCAAGHAYVERGWSPVPIAAGTKDQPLVKWGDRGRTTHDDVDAWWGPSGRFASGNLAILTGWRSSLWVLDVDVKDGQPGLATLAELEADDVLGALASDYVIRTPTGGQHRYFHLSFPVPADPGWTGQAGRIGQRPTPGIDTRAEGGYVLAPPSVLPGVGAYEVIGRGA